MRGWRLKSGALHDSEINNFLFGIFSLVVHSALEASLSFHFLCRQVIRRNIFFILSREICVTTVVWTMGSCDLKRVIVPLKTYSSLEDLITRIHLELIFSDVFDDHDCRYWRLSVWKLCRKSSSQTQTVGSQLYCHLECRCSFTALL